MRLVCRLNGEPLVRLIALLLFGVGALLLWEGAFPYRCLSPLPASAAAHLFAGIAIGLGIGAVSSVLGMAGGELLIPTLIFIFGADFRTAGSASILISLGIVLIGLWRYWRSNGVLQGRGIQPITFAMGAGSILGATLGGLAVAYAPVQFLKLSLGVVLILAAGKTMASHRQRRLTSLLSPISLSRRRPRQHKFEPHSGQHQRSGSRTLPFLSSMH